MMSGRLEGGLLSSAQRQAVKSSDSKSCRQASRREIPQGRSAGIRPSTPTASAVLNSSALPTSCFLKLFHDSSRKAVSRLSTETKYGVSDAERTFGGSDRSLPLLLVRTNKN